MNPFSLFRKFIKMVRGGAATWQIVVSCMLGVIIGMIPGFTGLTFALLILFAIVNLSLGLMLIGVLIGKALCLVLAPYTFEIGYVIIHQIGMEGLFVQALQTPFVALMGLDVYCLVGALPVAIVVGFIIGGIIARTIKLLRIGSMAAAAKSVKVQKLTSNIFTRIIMRILFGKQKKSLAEMLAFKHPILRKSGIVLLLIIVVLVVGFEMLFLNDITHSAMVGGLESSVGAEVNLKTVSLSLTGGRLELDGLQITDPKNPTHNIINVNKLHADVNIADLLTKRIVIEELVIGEVLNGAKREKAGTVYREPKRDPEKESDFSLSDYFENKEQILEYLAKLKEYLENQEKKQKDRTERTPEETREQADEMIANRGYLKVSAASLLTQRPLITIRKIKIEKLPIPNLGVCVIDINELSSDLALNEKPMSLSAKSDTGLDVAGLLDFVNAGAMHKLKMFAPNLPVSEMGLTDKCPIDISEAKAALSFDGQFNSKNMAFPIIVKLTELKSAVSGDKKVLGLDAATAKQMFESVKEMTLAANVSGAVDSPQLRVDVGKTLAGLKDGLIAAGKQQLANMAGEQLKKILPGGLPVDPGAIIKDPTKIIKDPTKIIKDPGSLIPGGLIPGKKDDATDKTPPKNPLDALKGVIPGKDDAKGAGSTTKPKDPVGGLLDGLRI